MGVPWALSVEYIGLVGFGTSTLLLFLVFPINYLDRPRGRWMASGCFGVAMAQIVGYVWTVVADPGAYDILQSAFFAILACELLGATILIGRQLVIQPRSSMAARGLGLVVLGMLAGLAPFCLLVLAPHPLGLGYLLESDVAILPIILIPASIAMAVLRHQILGIDRLVCRGLVALFVWLALTAGYSLGLDTLGDRVGAWPEDLAPGWIVLVVAVIGGSFPLVRARLQRALEHVLFRDTYSYADTLQEFSDELVHLTGLAPLATHTLGRLGETLDLSWEAVVVRDDSGPPLLFRWGTCPATLNSTQLMRALTAETGAVASATLVSDGTAIGVLAVGPKRRDVDLLPEDRKLLATVAHLLATRLQNALLISRLEAQVAALGEREHALGALSNKLMRVQEDQRRGLALDLHDDPLQRAILLARKIGDVQHPEAAPLRLEADEVIASLRAICARLRPLELDDLGLAAGLEMLVEDMCLRSDVAATFTEEHLPGNPRKRLESDLETALYRVAQEALNNCLKHADATHVSVQLKQGSHCVELVVADNGRGYTTAAMNGRGSLSLGILGMRERLRPWGGTVTIQPGRERGTTVTAIVSLEQALFWTAA